LGASPPQLFGRGGDRPHRPHGVGAYVLTDVQNSLIGAPHAQ